MQLQHWRRLASFVEASITRERDEQTDRQTKNSTFLAAMAAGETDPHQTWHGDRGP